MINESGVTCTLWGDPAKGMYDISTQACTPTGSQGNIQEEENDILQEELKLYHTRTPLTCKPVSSLASLSSAVPLPDPRESAQLAYRPV